MRECCMQGHFRFTKLNDVDKVVQVVHMLETTTDVADKFL